LVLRRRAPRVGITAAALATAAYLLLDQPYGPVFFAGRSGPGCLGAVLPLRRAVPWLAGYLVVVLAAAAPRATDSGHDVLIAASTLVLLLAAGAATGSALAARARSDAAARAAVAGGR
jgi:hypothetical protein